MSHFTVLVAGDVESQMEPYAEDPDILISIVDCHI